MATASILRGKVWGSRGSDIRERLIVQAARTHVQLRFTGFKRGWITKTVSFEAEGDRAALEAFQNGLSLEFDDD